MKRTPILLVGLTALCTTACLGQKSGATAPTTTVDLITETEQAVALGTTTSAPPTTAVHAVRQSGQEYYDGVRGYLMSVGAAEVVANCVALRATADYMKGLDPDDPQRQKSYFDLCGQG